MLKIRLQRVGKRHDPSFRIVVTEHTSGPKAGKHVEVLGSYDARKGKAPVIINSERVLYWIGKGAQPSGTVNNLLVSKSILSGSKRDVLPRKKISDIEAKRNEEKAKKEEEVKVAKEAEKEAETPEPEGAEEPTETVEEPVTG
ncbi:MAG: 30S ribosomal protein S16 [bacterium]|nr:30S ribosomal protein S16 [bacterium]